MKLNRSKRMRKAASTEKFVLWLPTGGFTHMMCSLRSCLEYAHHTGRKLVPLTEKHDIIGCDFYDFFKLRPGTRITRSMATEEEISWAKSNYRTPHPSLPVSICDIFISGHKPDSRGIPRYIINNIESICGDEWYLDPHATGRWEENQFTLSWGHFTNYWPSMLIELLDGVLFATDIQSILLERVSLAIKEIGSQFLAVHFRNTDYKSSFDEVAEAALRFCTDHKTKSIYWASDDMKSLKQAKFFFKSASISVFNLTLKHDVSQIEGAAALHALPASYLEKTGLLQRDLTIDFLCDVFILASGQDFIGSRGTVPFLVNSLRANRKNLLKTHMLG